MGKGRNTRSARDYRLPALSLPWNPNESNLKPAENEQREKRTVKIN
jgi:hypothetical protein